MPTWSSIAHWTSDDRPQPPRGQKDDLALPGLPTENAHIFLTLKHGSPTGLILSGIQDGVNDNGDP
jgi:hypothetical protein